MAAEGIMGVFLLLLLDGAGGEEPVAMGVEVPGVSGVGGAANLTCHHHLPTTHLYTLKWYHNDSEFYRYMPSDAHSPVYTRNMLEFKAQEVWRGDRGVTLTLSSLTTSASGEYKCEVIAEHPSFRTETRAKSMRVADHPPFPPPVIHGGRENRAEGRGWVLRCVGPRGRGRGGAAPVLTWYLEGVQMKREPAIPTRRELSLRVSEEQVW